ncbi:MAG: cysteine--tRNA ligase, partial [Selenomonadaceae bacterium]|nr:cysteine--tRNA ligase [Selenomonadaceae bacterium]
TLIDKGFAYEVFNGDVYFSVEKDEHYGKLSGRHLDDNEAGARVEIDGRKKHPMDFALWKAAKPGEPAWPSPWGNGRPGWHIECSAMSLKFLGKKFDFHGGGSDLIFPHHENEIAQSQCAIGDEHSFAQYWLHNGFITIDNEKMSKSAGNFFTVKDILDKYPGEIVRFFLIQTHYRSPLDFSEERIKEAHSAYSRVETSKDYLFDLIKKCDASDVSHGDRSAAAITVSKAGGLVEIAERLLTAFYDALDDDFNTALAISHMFELSKEINIYYHDAINNPAPINDIDAKIIYRVRDIYMEMAGIIGIFEKAVRAVSDVAEFKLIDDLMEIIIANRQAAREAKNWAVADDIRDKLKVAGIILEDTPQGVRWKRS